MSSIVNLFSINFRYSSYDSTIASLYPKSSPNGPPKGPFRLKKLIQDFLKLEIRLLERAKKENKEINILGKEEELIHHLKVAGIDFKLIGKADRVDFKGDQLRIIDYKTGHGSMILGHSHPEIVKSVHEAMNQGTQMGSSTDKEIKWGQLVRELVPCAEKVRFQSSGTEAVMMAMRLARAFTGKTKIRITDFKP